MISGFPLHTTSPATAIVPIKKFQDAKSRLAGSFGPAQRAEIAKRLAGHVLATIKGAELAALVVTADGDARILAADCGAMIVDDDGNGLNAALREGLTRAEAMGFGAALILPADLPHLTVGDVRAALTRPGNDGVVIAPSEDGGGTNALCVPLPSPLAPAYGVGSFRRHLDAALHRGLPLKVLRRSGLAIDADRPSDLGHT